jgi:hypothetical protein
LFTVEGHHSLRPTWLRGVTPKPPTQNQNNFGAKSHHTDRGRIDKVRPDRGNQSRNAKGHGHKKPEHRAHGRSQPYILVTAKQERPRSHQLAPHRFPSGSD